ncbi:hypothetical protein A0J61_05205 [Choanephora cucurbitarum]|uniref:Uncharacterized protein n=1 Tax=Choanephora cucurbitarum TaxID=101091 RepID=A0A1C7NCM0_9FUNG|nr:hypothetical protein A0J61_05205 [Choanephora cucurbitarum]
MRNQRVRIQSNWQTKKHQEKLNLVKIGSKRSRSEQDLMNVQVDQKQSFKNRAQNMLTSIPGFGHDKLESDSPNLV